MALLTLDQIAVAYQKQDILKDFHLDIEKGKLVSLLGPSGCGKTTTLRLIAGFLEAREGKFLFKDKDYTRVPVSKRNFGFVFQNYALFPHMSVFDNVAFGLRLRKKTAAETKKLVHEMLEVVNLSGYENRFTQELSGGQKQRVAIARALVIKPDLLLFDEPLSNLDANLRESMRVEIRRIQQELGITTVYVSHDQEECFSISDQVAIMNKGIIEQLDQPSAIYSYPKTKFVADFIGFKNFITFTGKQEVEGGYIMEAGGKSFHVADQKQAASPNSMIGAIRPDYLSIQPYKGEQQQANEINGRITVSTFLGRSHQYVVDTELGHFTINQDAEYAFASGEQVTIHIPKEKLVLVD
ncbi:ABC transporter ATP-binding protein [Alkalicoccobacillus porphyridii]|uniref:Carnitine transport ATP-binding protein OpuCA n=1 Tax=Alkalicoccobacillus porphyridii TaxID=2597270 RepID=A0A554A3Y9_9BACI|nr:ABC transporter ATP-binding protein [Alkalicoccobacillus porphyridii]TSB48414.1 ABC transporter ATP-binding protein [Alkalicoccobacillus porphyridii]